jgi:hypothetical protein
MASAGAESLQVLVIWGIALLLFSYIAGRIHELDSSSFIRRWLSKPVTLSTATKLVISSRRIQIPLRRKRDRPPAGVYQPPNPVKRSGNRQKIQAGMCSSGVWVSTMPNRSADGLNFLSVSRTLDRIWRLINASRRSVSFSP